MFPDTEPRIHIGGPVNPSAIILLHTDDWSSTNSASIGNGYESAVTTLCFLKCQQAMNLFIGERFLE
jgi:putative AlgH/UPF0301 family transcriptional regulator